MVPQRPMQPEVGPMAVEDVDDLDLGLIVSPMGQRREATPPQVIVTNSKKMARKPHRGEHHRGIPQGETEKRGREHRRKGDRDRGEPHIPFNTSLDSDFLNLFAY